MKNKRTYIIFSIMITLLSISVVNKTFQNDTYSAIKIGDYILHHGIDFVEHFNFNQLFYHNARWLFNVIIAFIYNKFDFFGIYIFTILNSIALGLIIFNTLLKRNKNIIISFLITILVIGFSCNALTARAQIISYILLFLEVIFIEKLIQSNKKRNIFALLILSVLIANIHTTIWPMVLILFLPYFAEYIIFKIIKKPKVLYSETKSIKLLIITFVIISLSGLLTPLGFLPYTYMFKTMHGFSTVFIDELKRVNVFFDVTMLILTIVYIYLLIYIRKKIKISDIFMVLGLFIMAIMASRNIFFFIIIGSISLSRLMMDNMGKIKKDLDYLCKSNIMKVIIIIPVLIMISAFFLKNIYKKPYVDENMYPVKASDYIIKNLDLDNLRIYNDFDYGSYLEFRGIKVFLDSRSEVYCKEFNNTSILEDWYNISYLKVNYKFVFEKYNFNYILLYRGEMLNNYLSLDSDYELVYGDNNFVLYKKVE